MSRRGARWSAALGGAALAASVLALPAPPAGAATAAVTALHDCGSGLSVLPRNDDGSTGRVPLGFTMNYFGTSYTDAFVNNNGNMTFRSPLSTFTPSAITGATGRPIIAPFFADVDTRGAGSNVVRYGQTTFAGRPAFCVDWREVGYFPNQVDKLNTFQLLIVERGDRGQGDVDLYLNYDQLQWETGSASGGTGGFGGTPALAGFASGTGADDTEFVFPGSLVSRALLDTNPTTGLSNYATNSSIDGRHLFSISNGVTQTQGGVRGTVRRAGTADVLPGAPVQLCRAAQENDCIFFTSTGATGEYVMTGVPDGDYRLTAFPPPGQDLLRSTSPVFSVVDGSTPSVDLELAAPTRPPASIQVIGTSDLSPGQVPVVIVGRPFLVRRQGCDGGVGSVRFTRPGSDTTVHGPVGLAENPPGTYEATVVLPIVGQVEAVVTVSGCPEQRFTLYIDPSGYVRTVAGAPIVGATVTLLRSDVETGPFTVVPDGSAIMSPANRTNPDLTDSTGHFAWDTVAGWYVVRASFPGCTGPGGQSFVETVPLEVPPPRLDIDLRLDCGGTAVSPRDLPAVVRNGTTFHLRDSLSSGGPTVTPFAFGSQPSVPLLGDWDGDGVATAGTYKDGVVHLRNSNTAGAPDISYAFGDRRGFPVAGDFDGDGLDTVAIFRNGVWQLKNANSAAAPTTTFTFGSGTWPSTIPVVGDWDGDGRDGVGYVTAGTWRLRNALSAGAPDLTFAYGPASGAYAVAGDWNGDGTDTPGVRVGADSWQVRNSSTPGTPDLSFVFGLTGDLPLVWRQ